MAAIIAVVVFAGLDAITRLLGAAPAPVKRPLPFTKPVISELDGMHVTTATQKRHSQLTFIEAYLDVGKPSTLLWQDVGSYNRPLEIRVTGAKMSQALILKLQEELARREQEAVAPVASVNPVQRRGSWHRRDPDAMSEPEEQPNLGVR